MPNPDPSNYYVLDFPNGAAVDAALKKATNTYTKEEINTALSGKQAVLDTAQLAAVNSGITADTVTQIENTISTVSDLSTTVQSLDDTVSDISDTVAEVVQEVDDINGSDVYLKGYTKAEKVDPITSAKSVNEAIGILEKAVEASSSKVYSNSTAGWDGQPTLISEEKAIYIYTDYDSASGSNIPAMKIGDGITAVVALPFSAANGVTVANITAWNSKMAGDVTINSKSVADSPTLDGDDIELTGYEKPQATSSILETDTVNEAIGKLEKAVEDAGSGSGKIYRNSSAGWAAQPTLISELNATYVYTDYDTKDGVNIPAIKIGDGVTTVVTLPFASSNGITVAKIAAWDSKVSARIVTDTLELY